MPVHKVGDKWAIGKGKAMYHSKEKADRAYKAYLAQKYSEGRKMTRLSPLIEELEMAIGDDLEMINPMQQPIVKDTPKVFTDYDEFVNWYTEEYENEKDRNSFRISIEIEGAVFESPEEAFAAHV
jgi:hypothetical protein